MKKVFATPIFSFITAMLLLSIIHIGCSSRRLDENQQNILEQPQENAPEQRQKTVTSAKPKETSIFSVIEIEDVEYPTLPVSIHLPFGVRPNNMVCLTEKHAYLTTERHLHVIDVSIPQRPVYLTSLAFADDLGKVLSSGNLLVVATRKTIHIVDVSHPSHPRVESTAHLPQQHVIKDLDIRGYHLYVMGTNDTLYVFSIDFRQERLVKAVELEKRWWLLSPKIGGLEIEQIPLSTSNMYPSGMERPLLSGNAFLQLQSSRSERVRASSEFLVMEALQDPTWDIQIYDACRVSNVKISIGGVGSFHLERDSRDHLTTKEVKTLARVRPALAYTVVSGKMHPLTQAPTHWTIDIDKKRFMGPVTDFQISDDLLCVVSEKGFLAIHHVARIENTGKGERSYLLSVTPLQPSRPISIAMGQDYVCVLAATVE